MVKKKEKKREERKEKKFNFSNIRNIVSRMFTTSDVGIVRTIDMWIEYCNLSGDADTGDDVRLWRWLYRDYFALCSL